METAFQYFPFDIALCAPVLLVPISLEQYDVLIYPHRCFQTRQIVPLAWLVMRFHAQFSYLVAQIA